MTRCAHIEVTVSLVKATKGRVKVQRRGIGFKDYWVNSFLPGLKRAVSWSVKTEIIPTRGTWLGIDDNIGKYLDDVSVSIEDGDLVLLFTDGITEAIDKNGEMYGQERLEQALNQYADLPVGKLLDRVIKEVKVFQEEQLDDMTLVAIKKCHSTESKRS